MAQVFNANSTSDEVIEALGDHAKGKHVIVTGANVGLGLETARSLVKVGANVTVACRNPALGEEAVKAIKTELPDAEVSFLQLDLGSFASIRSFVAAYKSTGQPLHLLINNAGVMACPKSLTTDGLETQFGVNHIGHFLLTTELLDLLKRSGNATSPSRIVNLSSLAQYQLLLPADEPIRFDDLKGEENYAPFERYGSSKLANILFTKELQRRLDACDAHVITVSLHPGIIMETNLSKHIARPKNAPMTQEEIDSYKNIMVPGRPTHLEGFKNIKQGTATTLVCALNPVIVPGEHYGDCQIDSRVHEMAGDAVLQRRLWEVSEQIVRQ